MPEGDKCIRLLDVREVRAGTDLVPETSQEALNKAAKGGNQAAIKMLAARGGSQIQIQTVSARC
jgi:hypothetical protein